MNGAEIKIVSNAIIKSWSEILHLQEHLPGEGSTATAEMPREFFIIKKGEKTRVDGDTITLPPHLWDMVPYHSLKKAP